MSKTRIKLELSDPNSTSDAPTVLELYGVSGFSYFTDGKTVTGSLISNVADLVDFSNCEAFLTATTDNVVVFDSLVTFNTIAYCDIDGKLSVTLTFSHSWAE